MSHPTGTITFLFTDVEGSTARWEQEPAAMQAAWHRQEALVRASIVAHGGRAYKLIGDAFQAAFQTASAALAAAVAAQRALVAASWETATPLRVRMALHTGTTEEWPDDYVGPLLNRLARLLSTGHGGQILLTEVTAGLVRDALPLGVTLRGLGERRLKDLTRPEHIWQVVADGLPAEFPPLRTLDARPHNLPRQPNALIGREREVADVAALLRRADVALVTLTGSGGTGKTRLALQVAADLLDDFPGGVWFVELAALRDAERVLNAVAQVLQIPPESGTLLLETLTRRLPPQRLLLVLDNFEHVAGAAPEVAALLAAASQLEVLATSRVPMQVYGEKEYPVLPLSLPDRRHPPPPEQVAQYAAVRLFVERAHDARPDFALTAANAPAVAEICARLDGLPLALELAAARSKLFAPEALLARLDARLTLLTGGSRDRAARQQTLRGAIDWSYDLLRPEEQQLFRRVAVFQGGRTLEAVAAVCNAGGDLRINVLEGMQALVDQSLLQIRQGRDGEPRFWLLETIHEYAREKLAASGEEPALRDAHLAYFTALAETAEPHLFGAAQPAWLDRLEDEHDNLRTALEWAARLRPDRQVLQAVQGLRLAVATRNFWNVRGLWSEARALLAGVLEVARAGVGGAQEQAAVARALTVAAVLAYRQRDLHASRVLAEEGLTWGRASGDHWSVASGLRTLGWGATEQGDLPAARTLLEEVLDSFRRLGNQVSIAALLWDLGTLAFKEGDLQAAGARFAESLALSRALGNQDAVAGCLGGLGQVASAAGDYQAARARHEEALVLLRALGDRAGIALSLNDLGFVAIMRGDYAVARALQMESLAVGRTLGDRQRIAWALLGLGQALAGAAGPAAGAELARATRVLGAARACLDAMGVVVDLADRPPYDRTVAHLRAALGETAFAAEWTAGQALSLEEAVALALPDTPEEAAPH